MTAKHVTAEISEVSIPVGDDCIAGELVIPAHARGIVLFAHGSGFLLRFTSVEIALLVLVGALLLAVETLNTSIEMLCDYVQPKHDPKIGKIKDVAAGATGVTEIGGAIAVAILLWPHVWAAIHR
jgi:diacylglycerol kinase (ATP)